MLWAKPIFPNIKKNVKAIPVFLTNQEKCDIQVKYLTEFDKFG